MEFEPIATINGSPKFIVRVLSALRDLKFAQRSGSSALQIAEYICEHYEHDGDVLSQVQTALKRALHNKMVQLKRSRKYKFCGPIASVMQNRKRIVCKIKKLRGRKCKKRRIRKIYIRAVRKAGKKQSGGINMKNLRNNVTHRICGRTNNFVKYPERIKFDILDWLKLTWTKLNWRNWSFN